MLRRRQALRASLALLGSGADEKWSPFFAPTLPFIVIVVIIIIIISCCWLRSRSKQQR